MICPSWIPLFERHAIRPRGPVKRRAVRPHPLRSSALLAVSTRCGLTGRKSHDRLRASFRLDRKQRLPQARVSRTASGCPLPHPPPWVSPQKRSCSSCGVRAPTSRGWSRRCGAITSWSSWCPSRVWTPGSDGSPSCGGRSAPGWPSGEFRSTGSSGDTRLRVATVGRRDKWSG